MNYPPFTYWPNEPCFGEDLPGTKPFLVDCCYKDETYVWYRFVFDGLDLGPEKCSNITEGEYPDWMEWQEDGWGAEFFLEPSESIVVETPFGKIENKFVSFALQEGIAPYQPFLVRFDNPNCGWFWTYCGYEYDFEPIWDIVHKLSISDFDASRRWEWWFAVRNRAAKIFTRKRMPIRHVTDCRKCNP